VIQQKRLEHLAHDDLAGLVSVSYVEDQAIDYKEELPDLDGKKPDDARKKLLSDVAAFGNAGGGDILFGVEEGRSDGKPNGIPVSLPGIENPNADALHRRWVGIIESGLDPKMAPKVRVRTIPIPNSTRAVVILRVPRSYAAPHMVKDTGRFVVRHGPENRPLDTAEIRSAFALSESWANHVKRFRDERVARISGDDTPMKVRKTTRLVIHLVPLAAARRGFAIDLLAVKARNPQPISWAQTYDPTFNVDGFLIVGDKHDGQSHTYTQFFRDGSVEVLITTIADDEYVYPTRIEPHVIKTASLYLPLLVAAGAEYPFAVTVTLLGMKSLISRPDQWGEGPKVPLPRDEVFLPDAVVEGTDADLPAGLRAMFDAMWQCLGHERSQNYDLSGAWTGKVT
jgi:hypothetical protein